MFEKAKQFTLTRPRLKRVVGWVLIVIGFLALVTPMTPGAFLLIIGCELIGIRILFLDKLIRRKEATVPVAVEESEKPREQLSPAP